MDDIKDEVKTELPIKRSRKTEVLGLIILGCVLSLFIVVLYGSHIDNLKKERVAESERRLNAAHSEYMKQRNVLKDIFRFAPADSTTLYVKDQNAISSLQNHYDDYVKALDNYNSLSEIISSELYQMGEPCNFCKHAQQEVNIKIDGHKVEYQLLDGFMRDGFF